MLLEGRIDLLAGLAKREDRIGVIGYPEEPMGNEIYTLVRHEADTSVPHSSPAALSGKKIGVLKSAVEDILDDYLKAHSIDARVVSYDDYESLFSAFDSGEVEILAAEGDGAYGREDAEVICTFGTSSYYLCVSASRPDLLEKLNEAQSLLATEEPNYIGTLRSKYYSASVSSHSFSDAERKWLSENKSLRLGYLDNYLPYSATDENGNATGLIKDLVPRMLSELGIPGIAVSYRGYENYADMIADIRSEEIDACFPVGGGLYYSEESGIYQSAPVASASTELVYRDSYDDADIRTFAVNENNRMQYYYVRTNFPEAEISLYPDIDACLKAVLKGEVGATTLNGLRAGEILKNSRYKGLYMQQLSQTDDRCFGVRIGNEGLLKLLNRGIKVVGPETIRETAYVYSGQLYTYTFRDLIRDHLWIFLTMSLCIAVLIILLIVRDLRHTRLASRMKSDFVSNMSHEIRTPITAILGMNEMIQRESRNPKVLQYSDNIGKAGESLLGIINDILDFSRIEAGHMELSPQPYRLSELLEELRIMILPRAEEKNLSFILEAEEKLPSVPVGDLQKLRQVVTNLLTNAVKYTEEGEVRMKVSEVSREEDSVLMEFSVSDTGIGIREEEMGKLYSAFDRLDMEKTRNIEGSGLGLTITQRLLALMDSEIRVESEYGKGSRFYFRIRQGISDASPMGTLDPSKAAGHRHRRRAASFRAPEATILIVDDTPMNLQVLCGLLKENDISIDTAESGSECLTLFGENRYDLVFLDQRMPNMDGAETLRELKKRFPEAAEKTPVVCLTANVLSGAREQMLKAGFDDYLTKPVNLYDMEQMLLKYLPKEKIRWLAKAEEPEEEEGIPAKICALDVLDTDKGLEYCGDAEEYLGALDIYRHSVREKSGLTEQLCREGEFEKLSLQLHSLKSTSRAIGAMELSELAAKLEAAAKTGDAETLNKEVPELLDLYRALGAALNDAMNENRKESQ